MAVEKADILLVGAGTMSATLGTLFQELDPDLNIVMVETLDDVAKESSDGWNNAGTGHAGYCELNYTPQDDQGQVSIEKALNVNSAFEYSLQLWSYLVEKGALPDPSQFINPSPHLSFVWGEDNVEFLRRRHAALSAHHLFEDMVFSEDPAQLREWIPLIMSDRTDDEPVAATRVAQGSDVDFGTLTRLLVRHLEKKDSFTLYTHHRVRDLEQDANGRWQVEVHNSQTGRTSTIDAGFVFLGAGGGALPLLHRSGIPEGKGYGGFPVSGQWLVCTDPDVVNQHDAKVYGKAPVGAPPMSVPHLDTRIINGTKSLLFGPFAGFTTKFLKTGSVTDLPRSLNPYNLRPMISAGFDNMPLTFYLIKEALQSHRGRMESLRDFYRTADDKQWKLAVAGQRVQIIKQDQKTGAGKLEFGTEVIMSADSSLAALLGASPGASTAADTMLDIVERCFSERTDSNNWQERLKAMFPAYGQSLKDNPDLLRQVRARTLSVLNLKD